MCFFLLSNILFAQEEVRVRVEALEKQVRELTDEVLRLRNALQLQEKTTEKLLQEKNNSPTKLYDGLIVSFQRENQENSLVGFYSSLTRSEIWIGGYLETQLQSQESRDGKNALDLSSLGLQVRSSWSSFFSVDAEFKISHPEKIEIIHAYWLTSIEDFFNLKIGVIRVPLGRYNLLYSPPAQSLGSIPLFHEFFLPSVWSEPGISLSGEWEKGIPFKIRYDMLLSNGLGAGSFQSNERYKVVQQEIHEDNNKDKQGSIRIEISPKFSLDIINLQMGVSGAIGKYDDKNQNQYKAISLDFSFRIGPFSFIGDYDQIEFLGEYTHFSIERSRETLAEFPQTASRMEGIYYQVDYSFFPQSWRSVNFLFGEKSTFALAFRYEKNGIHAKSLTSTNAYTVGFHFRPQEQMIFRVEYSFIEETIRSQNDWNNRFLASFATFF